MSRYLDMLKNEKRPSGELPKLTKPPFGSFGSEATSHIQNLSDQAQGSPRYAEDEEHQGGLLVELMDTPFGSFGSEAKAHIANLEGKNAAASNDEDTPQALDSLNETGRLAYDSLVESGWPETALVVALAIQGGCSDAEALEALLTEGVDWGG
jgi:hypothetical protein